MKIISSLLLLALLTASPLALTSDTQKSQGDKIKQIKKNQVKRKVKKRVIKRQIRKNKPQASQ